MTALVLPPISILAQDRTKDRGGGRQRHPNHLWFWPTVDTLVGHHFVYRSYRTFTGYDNEGLLVYSYSISDRLHGLYLTTMSGQGALPKGLCHSAPLVRELPGMPILGHPGPFSQRRDERGSYPLELQ